MKTLEGFAPESRLGRRRRDGVRLQLEARLRGRCGRRPRQRRHRSQHLAHPGLRRRAHLRRPGHLQVRLGRQGLEREARRLLRRRPGLRRRRLQVGLRGRRDAGLERRLRVLGGRPRPGIRLHEQRGRRGVGRRRREPRRAAGRRRDRAERRARRTARADHAHQAHPRRRAAASRRSRCRRARSTAA